MPSRDGAILRARGDHFEQAEPELAVLADGSYAMAVCCMLTNPVSGATSSHTIYLRPGPTAGSVVTSGIAYGWPSAVAAFAARDAWRDQQRKDDAW